MRVLSPPLPFHPALFPVWDSACGGVWVREGGELGESRLEAACEMLLLTCVICQVTVSQSRHCWLHGQLSYWWKLLCISWLPWLTTAVERPSLIIISILFRWLARLDYKGHHQSDFPLKAKSCWDALNVPESWTATAFNHCMDCVSI